MGRERNNKRGDGGGEMLREVRGGQKRKTKGHGKWREEMSEGNSRQPKGEAPVKIDNWMAEYK